MAAQGLGANAQTSFYPESPYSRSYAQNKTPSRVPSPKISYRDVRSLNLCSIQKLRSARAIAFCAILLLTIVAYDAFLADALALPFLNATSASSYFDLNSSFAADEGHHFSIPGTPLILHLTLYPTRIPLPAGNTLRCLHQFANLLASEPQSDYLDRLRVLTTYNVQATIAPVHCPGCGLTYREAIKVLAGLWYYASRMDLLFVQRYGVFERETNRMVAWGNLLTASPAPGMPEEMVTVS